MPSAKCHTEPWGILQSLSRDEQKSKLGFVACFGEGVHVMRKVRIWTVLGLRCANLGS